jgi:Carboxypeptidase regulatory-like domain
VSPNVSRQYCGRFVLVLALAVTWALMSGSGLSQSTVSTGSIVGTVTDASSAALPGARITIIGPTGQTIRATSNDQGGYTAGSLIPGAYRVRVEAKGFKTALLRLEVKVDNAANGSVQLHSGPENTLVEVPAAEVEVNTEQVTVQGVLTSSQIENMPVNGRNFFDLGQIEPGVQIQDGENFDPTKVGYWSISFGGRFGRTARINLDGVDVSDETVGGSTQDIPASSIQEFSLAQSSLDLSNDLTSSGAVNVTSKSGSNAIHGMGFGSFRDSAVGSAKLVEPFDIATGTFIPSPFQRNQQAGNVGGPILKDKLFYFLAGERTLQHLASPVAVLAPYGAYSGTFPANFSSYDVTARADYSLSPTARLFGRFNYFSNSDFATFFPSSFQVYQSKNIARNPVIGLDLNRGNFNHSIRVSYLKFENQLADAVRGTSLPFANYPVAINIGTFTVGPNRLAPQQTAQSNHEIKYDGSKIVGNHIIRFGGLFNHIQAGGYASFFKLAPQVTEFTAGPNGDPTAASLANGTVIVGNGQGFSTELPALGFPAGGLGPDNRTALYIGDAWKIRSNLTLTPGLRWVRDTGRTDSDLPAIPELNAAFPGYGNQVRQPNSNFAPQFGLAWDPKGDGRTVVRAGAGLYYENAIFNNVLFDRPLRLTSGAFVQFPTACRFGAAQPIPISPTQNISVDSVEGIDPVTGTSYCADTIGQAATKLAAFQNAYQALTPFNLTTPNPAFVGSQLAAGLNPALGLFAPNYRTPRAWQLNAGFQHELRRGLVLSADFLRNIETHSLLGVDVNHVGAARTFNLGAAQRAVANTIAYCGQTNLQAAIDNCSALNGVGSNGTPIGATIANFTAFGLGSALDTGSSCFNAVTPVDGPLGPKGTPLGYGCAFGGLNPTYGRMLFLEPISRSVYNALQLKLLDTVANPIRGLKAGTFQVSYSLSRFVNPLAFAGNTPPSNPTAANDQDFILQAADNDNPLRYTGPSLLDRTHQVSFGGTFDARMGFSFAMIAHFYSPLSSPAIVGSSGTPGQIFQTDFTGSGVGSNPLPGTKNGAFMREFGLKGLNGEISSYNTAVAGQATPAGQSLLNSGLFTVQQLTAIGAVAPTLAPAPHDQLLFPWLKVFDFRLNWAHTFYERYTLQPSVAFFNVFNLANFNLPPGTMTGWLNQGASSINSVHMHTQPGETGPESDTFRVGNGSGIFALGAPRAIEWGLKLTF